jgi:hypothetical protein
MRGFITHDKAAQQVILELVCLVTYTLDWQFIFWKYHFPTAALQLGQWLNEQIYEHQQSINLPHTNIIMLLE